MSDTTARVLAVSLNPRHGFSKLPQPSIRLLANLGVEGDAHCGATVQHLYLKRRDAAAPNHMQVHLLQGELLQELIAAGTKLGPGDLGENITTVGVDLLQLPLGTRLQLGNEAVVELTGLRTPCKKIDDFCPGLLRQVVDLSQPPNRRGRAGVMAKVLHGGAVCSNDPLQLLLPPSDRREPLRCI